MCAFIVHENFQRTEKQERFVIAMAHFVHSLDDDGDENDDGNDDDCTKVMVVH